MLKTEITLDSERFDAAIRHQALAFFTQALARDHGWRFDNTEQMRRAWRQVFEDVTRPVTAQTTQPSQTAACLGRTVPANPPAKSLQMPRWNPWNWTRAISN